MTASRARTRLAPTPQGVRSTLTGTRDKTPYGTGASGVAHDTDFCYNPATQEVNHG